MSGFLLDTNVLSEFSRSAIPPSPNVNRWVRTASPESLYASVPSFGEIQKGIELLPAGKKRADLESWLANDLSGWFGNNLLAVTKLISQRWGALAATAEKQGRPLGNIDGLIAATAIEHSLTVVTRNVRHFDYLGIPVLNPWEI